MIVKGTILDIDDINQNSFTNRETGEVSISGTVGITVNKPTQVIKVKVSPDLWKQANQGDLFKKMIGQQTDFFIEQKEYSFVRDGQPINGHSNNLFRLPAIAAK